MTGEQVLIIASILAALGLFVWGRWRHDLIAMAVLLFCVIAGLVPADGAFAGFAHPAVVTVACVLILSEGLQSSGAVAALSRAVLPRSENGLTTIVALVALAAILSAFMNNVGALALLMPVAVQTAERAGLPPGKVLMPVAFGSILGGMTTLIGTPPNLVVSGFRETTGAGPFAMFDFTPVGAAVAVVGVAFIMIFSRWLVPSRSRAGRETFETGAYLTEAIVSEGSKAAGMSLREVNDVLDDANAQVLGLIRDGRSIPAPSPFRDVRAGDVILIEAEPERLGSALSTLGLTLVGEQAEPAEGSVAPEAVEEAAHDARRALQSDEVRLVEYVVLPGSDAIGSSAAQIRLRSRFEINLLAISRHGRASFTRLHTTPLEAGDVILLQGSGDPLREFASAYKCVPLAERALRMPNARRAITASAVMGAAVAAAAFGVIPAPIAFATGAVAMIGLRIVPIGAAYKAVDWSVVVLLAAMIPVAQAMASTGAASYLAGTLLGTSSGTSPQLALLVILVGTMILTDFMNNAAAAAVVCPIAIETAASLGVSADPFLMAVAIGSSCAFLTPIGHQNNTLILGPGGFRFGDYWRLGLPLEVIVALVAVPLVPLVWPF